MNTDLPPLVELQALLSIPYVGTDTNRTKNTPDSAQFKLLNGWYSRHANADELIAQLSASDISNCNPVAVLWLANHFPRDCAKPQTFGRLIPGLVSGLRNMGGHAALYAQAIIDVLALGDSKKSALSDTVASALSPLIDEWDKKKGFLLDPDLSWSLFRALKRRQCLPPFEKLPCSLMGMWVAESLPAHSASSNVLAPSIQSHLLMTYLKKSIASLPSLDEGVLRAVLLSVAVTPQDITPKALEKCWKLKKDHLAKWTSWCEQVHQVLPHWSEEERCRLLPPASRLQAWHKAPSHCPVDQENTTLLSSLLEMSASTPHLNHLSTELAAASQLYCLSSLVAPNKKSITSTLGMLQKINASPSVKAAFAQDHVRWSWSMWVMSGGQTNGRLSLSPKNQTDVLRCVQDKLAQSALSQLPPGLRGTLDAIYHQQTEGQTPAPTHAPLPFEKGRNILPLAHHVSMVAQWSSLFEQHTLRLAVADMAPSSPSRVRKM